MLKNIRTKIGLSLSQISRLLGLKGDNAADYVRQIESNKKPLTGPMSEIIRYLDVLDHDLVPKYLVCDDIDKNSMLPTWIFHTQYPKFMAVFDVVDSKIIFIDRPIMPENFYWQKAVKEIRKHLL